MFLDEPDFGVDPSSWEFMRQEIVKTAKDGGTVIITGQNFALLEEFIDDIAVLTRGKIVCTQTKTEFVNQWNGKDEHDLRGAFENLQRKWGVNHDEKKDF